MKKTDDPVSVVDHREELQSLSVNLPNLPDYDKDKKFQPYVCFFH